MSATCCAPPPTPPHCGAGREAVRACSPSRWTRWRPRQRFPLPSSPRSWPTRRPPHRAGGGPMPRGCTARDDVQREGGGGVRQEGEDHKLLRSERLPMPRHQRWRHRGGRGEPRQPDGDAQRRPGARAHLRDVAASRLPSGLASGLAEATTSPAAAAAAARADPGAAALAAACPDPTAAVMAAAVAVAAPTDPTAATATTISSRWVASWPSSSPAPPPPPPPSPSPSPSPPPASQPEQSILSPPEATWAPPSSSSAGVAAVPAIAAVVAAAAVLSLALCWHRRRQLCGDGVTRLKSTRTADDATRSSAGGAGNGAGGARKPPRRPRRGYARCVSCKQKDAAATVAASWRPSGDDLEHDSQTRRFTCRGDSRT